MQPVREKLLSPDNLIIREILRLTLISPQLQ